MGLGGQGHIPTALPPRKYRYQNKWTSEKACTGAENVAPTGIRSPGRPAIT
jgi:hypothetical protein